MDISQELMNRGFSISEVNEADLSDYLLIKKACYKSYVDEYYGGWVDDIQIKINTDAFRKMRNQSLFRKIMLNSETVGFFAFNVLSDKIDGVSIQIIEKAQNKGIGSFYLNSITSISSQSNKPVYLKVFKSNPAQHLYKRFGFIIYDESPTHYLMRYHKLERHENCYSCM